MVISGFLHLWQMNMLMRLVISSVKPPQMERSCEFFLSLWCIHFLVSYTWFVHARYVTKLKIERWKSIIRRRSRAKKKYVCDIFGKRKGYKGYLAEAIFPYGTVASIYMKRSRGFALVNFFIHLVPRELTFLLKYVSSRWWQITHTNMWGDKIMRCMV